MRGLPTTPPPLAKAREPAVPPKKPPSGRTSSSSSQTATKHPMKLPTAKPADPTNAGATPATTFDAHRASGYQPQPTIARILTKLNATDRLRVVSNLAWESGDCATRACLHQQCQPSHFPHNVPESTSHVSHPAGAPLAIPCRTRHYTARRHSFASLRLIRLQDLFGIIPRHMGSYRKSMRILCSNLGGLGGGSTRNTAHGYFVGRRRSSRLHPALHGPAARGCARPRRGEAATSKARRRKRRGSGATRAWSSASARRGSPTTAIGTHCLSWQLDRTSPRVARLVRERPVRRNPHSDWPPHLEAPSPLVRDALPPGGRWSSRSRRPSGPGGERSSMWGQAFADVGAVGSLSGDT
jgi:hypothetical protein